MTSSFICVIGEWKQRSVPSKGLIFKAGRVSQRTVHSLPARLGRWDSATSTKRSSVLERSCLKGAVSKERSSVERLRDWQVVMDNEGPSHHTRFSWKGSNRSQLVPELVFICAERNLTIEHLIFRSESEEVSCSLELSKDGSKLSPEETQRLQRDLGELTERQSQGRQRTSVQTISNSNPELPYIDYRDRFVDYDRGVAFYTDNHATPTYTTLTAIVPNSPSFLVHLMSQMSQMPLHVIFASLSTYNGEGKTRHDVYHVVTHNGEQLDAAQCDALVDIVTRLFDGEKNSQDGR